jgi:hypothetical protein
MCSPGAGAWEAEEALEGGSDLDDLGLEWEMADVDACKEVRMLPRSGSLHGRQAT